MKFVWRLHYEFNFFKFTENSKGARAAKAGKSAKAAKAGKVGKGGKDFDYEDAPKEGEYNFNWIFLSLTSDHQNLQTWSEAVF